MVGKTLEYHRRERELMEFRAYRQFDCIEKRKIQPLPVSMSPGWIPVEDMLNHTCFLIVGFFDEEGIILDVLRFLGFFAIAIAVLFFRFTFLIFFFEKRPWNHGIRFLSRNDLETTVQKQQPNDFSTCTAQLERITR